MSKILSYKFNVEIWKDSDSDNFNWIVAEEFECETTEFLPIGWGTADSYDEAVTSVGEVVRSTF